MLVFSTILMTMEHGQLPKGVQQGFITEVTSDDEAATTAAMAIEKIDEVEPPYEEAQLRVYWPEWRRVIDVELQTLKSAETWDVVERLSSINIVDIMFFTLLFFNFTLFPSQLLNHLTSRTHGYAHSHDYDSFPSYL